LERFALGPIPDGLYRAQRSEEFVAHKTRPDLPWELPHSWQTMEYAGVMTDFVMQGAVQTR